MKELLRQAALIALSAVLSWLLLLRVPPSPASPRSLPARSPVIELTPLVVDRSAPPAGKIVTRSAEPGPGTAGPPPMPVPEQDEQAAPGEVPAEQMPTAQDPAATEPPPQDYVPPPVTAKEPVIAKEVEQAPEPEKPMAQPPPGTSELQEAAPSPAPAPTTAKAGPEETQTSEEGEEGAPAEGASEEPSAAAPLPEKEQASAPAEAAPAELGTPEGTRTVGPALGTTAQPKGAAPSEGEARAAETNSRSLDGTLPSGRDESPSAGRDAGLPSGRDAASSVAALMNDQGLVAEARDEFEHGQKRGFATVLLATPEDQIAIARFFSEELVLVPRHALDPGNTDPRYFHLSSAGEVEEVEGPAPLERHRQYRDLFDYDYARLPVPLRDLRRTVLQRGEVYLFAALLSPQEWALIIARRREALEHSGRELSEVRRFVLRYHRLPTSGFDLLVEEIVFADGTRFRPAARGGG